MLLRSTTYLPVAATFISQWNPRHLPNPAWQQSRASDLHPSHQQRAAAIRHNFTIFAAGYAPIVDTRDVLEANTRLIVVVPIATSGGIVAHCPMQGLFGAIAVGDRPLKDQAADVARFLCGATAPFLAGYTRDSNAHAIFVVPVTEQPVTIISDAATLRQAVDSNTRSAWVAASALHVMDCYTTVLMAVARLRHLMEPSEDSGLRIGAWQRAVPLVPYTAASVWNREAPSATARGEWASFIAEEAQRAQLISAAMRQADRGDGDLKLWAENVKSAADFIGELECPPQGLPTFQHDVLRLTCMPEPPAPIVTAWLHSVPPQQVPAGLVEVEWHEVHVRWARVRIAKFVNMTAAHDIDCYINGTSDLPYPKHEVLGPGAFCTSG